MLFTIASNAHLLLGGANQTKPTLAKSGTKDETDPACFLLNGIPQNVAKTHFADVARNEVNGHSIKHAIINIISAGATITPAARTMTDTSAPDSTHGQYVTAPDVLIIENGMDEIFNFDLINLSGGNMIVEVLPFS
jgi:hypothetical protein